jgi:2,3-bisphosphoglycerate-dependent phosphoglycerate mutase
MYPWEVCSVPKVYVIRHAQVQIDPQLPPHEWQLSDEAERSVQELVMKHTWTGVSAIYHSPERKAADTAAIIGDLLGLPTKVCPNLRELEMKTGFLSGDEFRRRVAEYLSGGNDPDFEDYNVAQKRIVNCLQAIIEAEAGKSVAVVSHGRILTVLYSYLLGHRLGEKEWQSIGLPDLSVINLETNTIESGFFAGKRIVNPLRPS